jgi:hypothetical protein
MITALVADDADDVGLTVSTFPRSRLHLLTMMRQLNDDAEAVRTWMCSPMARAPASTSFNVVSVVVALVGLTSTITRVAVGTSSRSNPSRFATNSELKKLIPVRLASVGQRWRQAQA